MRKFLIICAVEIGLLINLLWYWHNIPLYSPTVYWLLDSVLVSADDPPSPAPKDGKWTCAELQITLSFDGDDPDSLVRKDGREIPCRVTNERYSREIYLYCCDPNYEEFYTNTCLFAGEMLEVGDDSMIILDFETDMEYVFYREAVE